MSIARRTLPSRLELKRRPGSFSDAPLAKVSFTTFLYDSPVQMMPSCDQTGVPIHFHSSTTSGSASWMSLRILPRVFPRQSPSSAILFEMSSDAGWPWFATDFFMFSPSPWTGSLHAELPGVVGVQPLPAAGLHGLGAGDASNGLPFEQPLQHVEADVPAGSAHGDESTVDVVPER